MWFWWFAFACDLLIPLTMILFGRISWKRCPSKINSWYGYRTERSMKNMDTWKFAHAHFGKQWWKIGWWILLPSALILLPVYKAAENAVAIVFLAVMTVQTVFMLYPIFQTERALKERFNDDGTFKESSRR